MTVETLLILIAALQLKHLLADFFFQTGWMVQNKGYYGHPAGIAHAAIHLALTFVALLVVGIPLWWCAALAVLEGVVHYHVDWAKAAVTRKSEFTASDARFWNWIGLDQFAHHVTYLALVYLISGLGLLS